MEIRIDTFVTGPLETNSYVIRCGDARAVVDPGMSPGDLVAFCRNDAAAPTMILLTHGHGDHIAGVADIKAAFEGVRLLCPAADADMLSDAMLNMSQMFGVKLTSPPADELIEPGDTVTIGVSQWQALDTSGHTPGGMSYHCAEAGVVISGDALFDGSIGRTDIPGASAARLLRNIRAKLLALPGETRVLPGHGPETTIGREKRLNPFFV